MSWFSVPVVGPMASTHGQRLAEHRALYKTSLIWNIEQGMGLKGADGHLYRLNEILLLPVDHRPAGYLGTLRIHTRELASWRADRWSTSSRF